MEVFLQSILCIQCHDKILSDHIVLLQQRKIRFGWSAWRVLLFIQSLGAKSTKRWGYSYVMPCSASMALGQQLLIVKYITACCRSPDLPSSKLSPLNESFPCGFGSSSASLTCGNYFMHQDGMKPPGIPVLATGRCLTQPKQGEEAAVFGFLPGWMQHNQGKKVRHKVTALKQCSKSLIPSIMKHKVSRLDCREGCGLMYNYPWYFPIFYQEGTCAQHLIPVLSGTEFGVVDPISALACLSVTHQCNDAHSSSVLPFSIVWLINSNNTYCFTRVL